MIKNKIHIALLAFLGAILLNGCSLNNKKNTTGSKSDTEQTITSEDGLFSITIPAGWIQITDYELNDDADIQAKKGRTDSYAIVLTDSKEDLDYTFEEWKEIVMDNILSSWNSHTIINAIDTTIDGQPAKQYEIEGTSDRTKIVMLATYIDGEKYFAQILTWTIASKYKSSEEEFRMISNSIRGLK